MSKSNSNLFSALQQAKRDDYLHDFLSEEVEQNPSLRVIDIIPCLSCGATLYLIADNDRKGTWVHHWDI